MTKFLSQGEDNYWYYVELGWAYRPSYDNTVICIQQVDMPDGYYLNDKLDENAAGLGAAIMEQKTFLGKTYLETVQQVLISAVTTDVKEIQYLFGITKALAQSLSKLGETMLFSIRDSTFDHQIVFQCLATRKELLDLLQRQNDHVFMIDPLKYYTVYDKTMIYGLYLNNSMFVLTNAEKTQFGIILTIDPDKRLNKLML